MFEKTLLPGEAARARARLGIASIGSLPLYRITLELSADAAGLKGCVELRYPNHTDRALSVVPLLLHPNAVRERDGSAADAPSLSITQVKGLGGIDVRLERLRPTLANLRLGEPLKPGRWLHVELHVVGRLQSIPASANDLFGQGLSSLGILGRGKQPAGYGLLATGDGITTIASAYPMVAPFHEGTYDVSPPPPFGDLAYNTPANFSLEVSVPRGVRVFSSLEEMGSEGSAFGTRQVYRSIGALRRDLVVVAGRDLQKSSVRLGEVEVKSIFRARDARAGKRLLHTARQALELFSERFGPYPYRELGISESTLIGGAGGVEFPGMVLVSGMFYREADGSGGELKQLLDALGGVGLGALHALGKGGPSHAGPAPIWADAERLVQRLGEFVVAHEVAHQYFAGLVGSDCRIHPAVDEPLAQFAAGELMRARYGDVIGRQIFDLNARATYAVYRLLGADSPAARPVSAFPSALAYAGVVYGKAPYLYVALRERLGPARFDRALRAAVDAHRHRLVTLDEWIQTLERTSGARTEVRQLAVRYLHDARGDQDLGVDASGEALFELVLGETLAAQLSESFRSLGLTPKTLLQTLLQQALDH